MSLRCTFRFVFCVQFFSALIGTEVFAGPPFKTDDPQPVDFLHWEFYVASVQEIGRHEIHATCPHFEVNYGVVPNMQLHVILPFGYVHTDTVTHFGFSDIEIGVKYRIVEETETHPQVGFFPLLELPTGDENKQLGAGRIQACLPVWFQKSWGKLTTYAGGGFWYNSGPQQKNWVFTGWEVQYDFSSVVTLGGEFYCQTADAQDSESKGGFNVGGFINLNENHHILFSFGSSVSGPETITGYIGYQLTI